ncbi:MAG: hypothetical protein IPN08_09775 [Bacteroidales bacterium]|nr:hypothetical protein [Bacteroidales bacterium]
MPEYNFTLQKKVNRIEYTDTMQFEESFATETHINESERLYRLYGHWLKQKGP